MSGKLEEPGTVKFKLISIYISTDISTYIMNDITTE